jgi:hypothetical protein
MTIFCEFLHNINKALKAKDLRENLLEAANSMQYDEFLPLINKVLVDRIPPQ